MSTFLENKFIDWFFRGQAYTPPTTLYVALMTAAAGPTGGGTEVSGGAYARVAIPAGLANWAGTQGDGTTAASTGTSGKTSNNNALAFPTPSAAWGTVVGIAIFDAANGGNQLFQGALTTQQTVNANNTVSYNPAQLTLTVS
jgi:type 1 fimbria pilin